MAKMAVYCQNNLKMNNW